VEQRRGLQGLNRGWRTPDPSFTRGAGRALPLCAPAVGDLRGAEARRDFGVAAPVGDTTGLPRPETDAEHLLACTDYMYFKDAKQLLARADDSYFEDAEQSSAFIDDQYFKFGVWASGGHRGETSYSLTSPPRLAEESRSRAQGESGYAGREPVPVIHLSVAIPEPRKVVGAPGPMSFGSVGHPLACGEPCKYAWKKGCKDGVNCNRCHFCKWSRYGKRRQRGQTSVPGTCFPCTQ